MSVHFEPTTHSMNVLEATRALNTCIQDIGPINLAQDVKTEIASTNLHVDSDDINNTSQNRQPMSNRRRIIKKRLNLFREQLLKAEQDKIAVLKSLKAAIDESNAIQYERNKILNDIAKAITGPGHSTNT